MQNHLNKIKYLIPGYKKFKVFFIIFYAVGVAGIAVPYTNPLFIQLIPATLILNLLILTLFHRGRYDSNIVIVSFLIYLIGYAIEVFGVSTGLIFGEYEYGNGLGFKVFDTPLIIGVNWLILVYMTSSVTRKYNIRGFPGIIAASLIMLLYDLVLEQVAPKMDMWYWSNNQVPLQNYVVWFILALGFHSLFKVFNIQTKNSLAEIILVCQFCFFLSLFIFFDIIK